MASIINPIMSTPDDLPVQRFYLRKIEGADVLLADETNFLRQELHKWAPVAPTPPPLVEVSLSTRKPRPTKQQKLMAQLGITDPQELPPQFRPKQPGTKKKEKPGEGGRKDSEGAVGGGGGGLGGLTSHTPPGSPDGRTSLPGGMGGFGLGLSGSANSMANSGRHPTFSFDSLSANAASSSYPDLNSPLFATTSTSTHPSITRPTVTSPLHHTSMMDPTLDNMFGRPSSSSGGPPGGAFNDPTPFGEPDKADENDGAGFNLASPKAVGVGVGERSDPIDHDIFGSLTNEPEEDGEGGRGGFGAGFGVGEEEGEGRNAFEEGLEL